MKSISIALATYNGCKHILEQLESLQKQAMLPFEVIVCDDASTDDTINLVNDFAKVAAFSVKVFRNETKLGYRDNFMKAANLCSGDLIAFCDQDDIWDVQKLQEVEKRFTEPSVMLVCHNADIINSRGDILSKVHLSDATEDIVYEPLGVCPWHFPLGFTMTFRRELLAFSELRNLSSDYYNGIERLAHDQWIFLLAASFGQVVRMPDTLAKYRQHDHNTFGIKRPSKTFMFKLNEKFTKFVNFDLYVNACEDIIKILEMAFLLPLSQDLHTREASAIKFFCKLRDMYKLRYNAYANRSLYSRTRSWTSLRISGGYDESRACHFEKKEASRDFLLGVVMAGLHNKRHQGPAMDWSLIVRAVS